MNQAWIVIFIAFCSLSVFANSGVPGFPKKPQLPPLVSSIAAPSAFAQSAAIPFRGLENISNLDKWTRDLGNGPSKSLRPDQLDSNAMFTAWNDAQKKGKTVNQWYDSSLLGLAGTYSSAAEYSDLAHTLFLLREQIRVAGAEAQHTPQREEFRRRSMLLLQNLLVETLAMGIIRFGEKSIPLFEYVNPDLVAGTGCYDAQGRPRGTKALTGSHICQGDVVAMKGVAGTSSLLARMSEYPGNFSHSNVAYYDVSAQNLKFIEALIEDGVKLRPPWPEIAERTKKRLAVYRLGDQQAAQRSRVVQQTDLFIQYMQETQRKSSGQEFDLQNRASFPYNFSFNTNVRDSYFCSQIPFEIYNLAQGGTQAQSPATPLKSVTALQQAYPQAYWSTIHPTEGKFFTQFLGMKSDFYPAPSDVELNPHMKLTSYQSYPPTLVEERLDNALVDVLSALIRRGDPEWNKILESLNQYGQKTFRKNDPAIAKLHAALKQSQNVPAEFQKAIDTVWSQLPETATLNQIAFFALYNNVITPQLRKDLHDKIRDAHNPVGPVEMRGLVAQNLGKSLDSAKAVVALVLQTLNLPQP